MKNNIKRLVVAIVAAVGGLGQRVAWAAAYDPSTDMEAVQTSIEGYVATGVTVLVAVLGASLAIAAVVWLFNKARSKLFGRG